MATETPLAPASNTPAPQKSDETSPLTNFMRTVGPLLWPAVPLVLLLLFNAFFTEGFFHLTLKEGKLYGSIIDVLKNGSPVLILSLGMTLVIATRGIDLSVGATMAIAAAVAGIIINPPIDSLLDGKNIHLSIGVTVAIALACALIAGLWNGVLVAYLRFQPIVATLILMVAGRGLSQLLTKGQKPDVSGDFQYLGSGFLASVPVPILIAAVFTFVILVLIRTSALGLFIEAVGSNPAASRIAGINASGVKLACYTLCGLLSGVAGLIVAADLTEADVSDTGIGIDRELDAILAVALGGTSLNGGRFSIVGSVLGAILLQLLNNTVLAHVAPEAIRIVKAAVVVSICLLQSPKFRERFGRIVRQLRGKEATV